MLHIENGMLTGCVDIRFPVCTTKEAVLEQVQAAFAAKGFRCEARIQSDPHHTPKDTPFVQDLLAVYEEQTGTKGECIAIGGGTYARHFSNAVSYGPEKARIENPAWVGGMHGPDEGVSEQLLKDAFRIYALTIGKLMQLTF